MSRVSRAKHSQSLCGNQIFLSQNVNNPNFVRRSTSIMNTSTHRNISIFHEECATVNDLVKSSVENLSKTLFSNTLNKCSSRKHPSLSPSKRHSRAMTTTDPNRQQPLSQRNSVLVLPGILIIQRFIKRRLMKVRMVKRLRVIGRFRSRVLAVYKGWVIR